MKAILKNLEQSAGRKLTQNLDENLQKTSERKANAQKVSRISISLPENVLEEFDQIVAERGFDSRSQAICDIITKQIIEHREVLGEEIMTGTINLVYDHTVSGVQKKLQDLQYEYLDEVISTLNVNLTPPNTMAVILVQGPASRLKIISNKMTTLKGVVSGNLLLSSCIIPPIHPMP